MCLESSSENWGDLTKVGVITLCMGQAYKHLDAMVVGALDFGFQSNKT
jgi:hypothetical protein